MIADRLVGGTEVQGKPVRTGCVYDPLLGIECKIQWPLTSGFQVWLMLTNWG